MSVDILPASLPLDATQHFSKLFLPYVEGLVDHYAHGTRSNNPLNAALQRATIAEKGLLRKKHNWLQGAVDEFYGEASASAPGGVFTPVGVIPSTGAVASSSEVTKQPAGVLRKKRVLMLGSGMVAGPAVDEFAKRGDIQLLIGMSIMLFFVTC